MIVNDFCLSSAELWYVVINVWNFESHMHIVDQCAPRKIANGAENLFFAGAVISVDRFLPQIPRRNSIRYYRSNQCFEECQFNVNA
jgi:hypothetical protein